MRPGCRSHHEAGADGARRPSVVDRRGPLLAWIAGAGALVWLILRSGTKPTRLSYPCQQAALSETQRITRPDFIDFPLTGLEGPMSEEERALQESVHRFAEEVMRPVAALRTVVDMGNPLALFDTTVTWAHVTTVFGGYRHR